MNAIVQTPTSNLFDSLIFYKKVGFKIVSERNPTIVSDGNAVIMINDERHARAGIRLYSDDWSSTIDRLKVLTTVVDTEEGAIVADVSGVWIYLIKGKGPSVDITEVQTAVLGNYAGVSIETISIAASMKIWAELGFTLNAGGEDNGWVDLKNEDGFGVGLMKPNVCPHLFFNPSLTYFNGSKNPEIIQEIRDVRIDITEEITHFNKEGIVDNIIIRDPGGLGFFLFNDGE